MDLSVLKMEENCDLLRSKISTAIIICYKMKKTIVCTYYGKGH